MLHFPKWKIAVVLFVLIVGTLLAIPSMLPRATLDALPSWVPKATVNLGLDLQGGSHLLYEIDMQGLIKKRLDAVLDETRTSLRKANLGYTNPAVQGGKVTMTLIDQASVGAAREALKSVVSEGMDFTVDGTIVSIGFSDAGLTHPAKRTEKRPGLGNQFCRTLCSTAAAFAMVSFSEIGELEVDRKRLRHLMRLFGTESRHDLLGALHQVRTVTR